MPFVDALIGAAGAVGGSLLSNSGSRRSQDRADKYNLQQWHRQNAYNDPSAQMGRLKNAGLNPNLIYGTPSAASVGNADKVQPSKAAPYSMESPIADIQKYANTQQQNAQTDNLKSQNDVIVQDSILRVAQIAQIGLTSDNQKIRNEFAPELYKSSAQAATEQLRNLEQQTIGGTIDNYVKDQTSKNRIKTIYYAMESAKKSLHGKELDNQMKKFEVKLNEQGITKSDALWTRVFAPLFETPKALDRKSYNKFLKLD
jgi:hypothetical protein